MTLFNYHYNCVSCRCWDGVNLDPADHKVCTKRLPLQSLSDHSL